MATPDVRTPICDELTKADIYLENVQELIGKSFTFVHHREVGELSDEKKIPIERNGMWGEIRGVQVHRRPCGRPSTALFLLTSISAVMVEAVEKHTLRTFHRFKKVSGIEFWPEAPKMEWQMIFEPPSAESGESVLHELLLSSFTGVLTLGHHSVNI